MLQNLVIALTNLKKRQNGNLLKKTELTMKEKNSVMN